MSYHVDFPPVIKQTDASTWELQTQSGSTIATYNQTQIASPDDWFEDAKAYIINNAPSEGAAIEDGITISILRDWEVEPL